MVMTQMVQNFKVDEFSKSDLHVKANKTSAYSTEMKRFGSVYENVIANQKQVATVQESQNQSTFAKDVKDLENVSSLKELFELLEVNASEELLFVTVDEQTIPVEELLQLNQLADLLQLDLEELQAILSQLMNENTTHETVWDLLSDAPAILEQLVANLSADNAISKEDALALLQTIKLAQLVAQKVDTTYQQQFTLETANYSFQQAMAQLSIEPVEKTSTTSQTATFVTTQQILQLMQQDKKVEATIQTNTNPNLNSNASNENIVQGLQNSTVTKTVTVTLPTNEAKQSEAFMKEMQNLINRSQLSGTQGSIKLMLKLFPENLGQIRIEITQQNGILTARLLASTAAGKELLDSNLNQLKASFVAQNIQMERVDVTQALSETDKNNRDQNFFNNFFKPREEYEEEQETDDSEEEKEFSDFLTEEVQQ